MPRPLVVLLSFTAFLVLALGFWAMHKEGYRDGYRDCLYGQRHHYTGNDLCRKKEPEAP